NGLSVPSFLCPQFLRFRDPASHVPTSFITLFILPHISKKAQQKAGLFRQAEAPHSFECGAFYV
ncbi:MAG: hypothetical protein ACI3W8_06575, partial [Oscillospiraceae bacterium]